MLRPSHALLLLCAAVGAVDAAYKQWVPDTNYENRTNWDKGRVPCGNDVVQFPAQRKVSVFVETAHAVRELWLPVDGEFILNSGAGFSVPAGRDADCGTGVTTQFRHPEALQWFDPALWRASATLDDLQHGDFLFSVHEESVPCRHDDVLFRAHSSFRVDTGPGQTSIPVKSVTVLGRTFESGSEFREYLGSRSGRLQFHGSSSVAVGNPGCQDPSGCDCGNSANRQRICASVTCGSPSCKKPLLPSGHCCNVCGAIVAIRYGPTFNLRSYRQRVQHFYLNQAQFKSIRLGMSKVFRSRRLMGVIPFGTTAEIQVVILDEEKGARSEALARLMVEDVRAQGSDVGITEAEFQASSGTSGSSGDQSVSSAGMVAGVVVGVLIIVAVMAALVVLVRKGVVKMPPVPSLPSLSGLKSNSDIGDLGGPIDRGYDNPMFDRPDMLPDIPGMYGADSGHSIAMTRTGVHFINPVYDENETDFTA